MLYMHPYRAEREMVFPQGVSRALYHIPCDSNTTTVAVLLIVSIVPVTCDYSALYKIR